MIFHHRLQYCLFILLIAVFPVQADDFDVTLSKARDVFLQAVDGDKPAVRNAIRRFRSLNHERPAEPVYLAYYGACVTLQGRDAVNNIDKKRLTEDGLRDIDRALGLLSTSDDYPSIRRLDTLLVAANSFIHIPAFFNRYEKGKSLLHDILEDKDFNGMAAGFRAASYFTAALVARGDGDEHEYHRLLELTVSTDPQGRNGRFATALLEESASQ